MKFCFFLLMPCVMGFAQTPYLTNINIQQQSADKIIITYDLAGKSKDSYAVKVVRIEIINSPKGIVPQSITGDIGNNISAGKNKTIFWDVLKDVERLDKDIKAVIEATPIPNDNPPNNNKRLINIGLSTTSGAGTTLLVLGINKMKEGKTLYRNYESTTDPLIFLQNYGTTRNSALASAQATYNKGQIYTITGGVIVAASGFLWVRQKLSKNSKTSRLVLVPTSSNSLGLVYRF